MGVLSELKPSKVFQYFEEICGMPHGSGNLQQISDYLVKFASDRELKYRQDEALNVIIWKEGSKGCENAAPVILQGHMDMVAVKTDACTKDLETEGLDLEIDGDYIFARGTTLGGDDGIAVAYMLAILDDDTLAHPPIEAVFTTDEEIGMLGATALDMSDLRGRVLMNMDSENDNEFTVSCAGGATATCALPYKRETINAPIIEIRLSGFTGGHSGVEIDKGRMNANCAMGRILLNLFQNVGMRLIVLNGGAKDNAIADVCEAAIAVLPQELEKAESIIKTVFAEIKEEHKISDPNAEVVTNILPENLIDVFSGNATLATIIMLANAPSGVQRMNPEIKDMVQTSLNLGVLRTDEDAVRFTFSVRSSKESEKKYLIEKLRSLTEIFGGGVEVSGDYPGWDFQSESRLRDIMEEEYKKIHGKTPIVQGVHAGLECGIFASKLPGLDAVSFGPQMYDIHTTGERISISSIQITWELIKNTLAAL